MYVVCPGKAFSYVKKVYQDRFIDHCDVLRVRHHCRGVARSKILVGQKSRKGWWWWWLGGGGVRTESTATKDDTSVTHCHSCAVYTCLELTSSLTLVSTMYSFSPSQFDVKDVEKYLWWSFYLPCIYSHASGVIVGDSGLCCCVPCLLSAVTSLCLLIL